MVPRTVVIRGLDKVTWFAGLEAQRALYDVRIKGQARSDVCVAAGGMAPATGDGTVVIGET